eukprot:9318908-Alexandrium_andersonii.AAC.1
MLTVPPRCWARMCLQQGGTCAALALLQKFELCRLGCRRLLQPMGDEALSVFGFTATCSHMGASLLCATHMVFAQCQLPRLAKAFQVSELCGVQGA